MKLLILSLISVCAFAQTPQICYLIDKANPGKQICRDISSDLKTALTQFVANTTTQPDPKKAPVPVYQGIADLIFSNLSDGLFTTLVLKYSPAVIAAQATADMAGANVIVVKAAVVAKASVVDPK